MILIRRSTPLNASVAGEDEDGLSGRVSTQEVEVVPGFIKTGRRISITFDKVRSTSHQPPLPIYPADTRLAQSTPLVPPGRIAGSKRAR